MLYLRIAESRPVTSNDSKEAFTVFWWYHASNGRYTQRQEKVFAHNGEEAIATVRKRLTASGRKPTEIAAEPCQARHPAASVQDSLDLTVPSVTRKSKGSRVGKVRPGPSPQIYHPKAHGIAVETYALRPSLRKGKRTTIFLKTENEGEAQTRRIKVLELIQGGCTVKGIRAWINEQVPGPDPSAKFIFDWVQSEVKLEEWTVGRVCALIDSCERPYGVREWSHPYRVNSKGALRRLAKWAILHEFERPPPPPTDGHATTLASKRSLPIPADDLSPELADMVPLAWLGVQVANRLLSSNGGWRSGTRRLSYTKGAEKTVLEVKGLLKPEFWNHLRQSGCPRMDNLHLLRLMPVEVSAGDIFRMPASEYISTLFETILNEVKNDTDAAVVLVLALFTPYRPSALTGKIAAVLDCKGLLKIKGQGRRARATVQLEDGIAKWLRLKCAFLTGGMAPSANEWRKRGKAASKVLCNLAIPRWDTKATEKLRMFGLMLMRQGDKEVSALQAHGVRSAEHVHNSLGDIEASEGVFGAWKNLAGEIGRCQPQTTTPHNHAK